MRIAILTDAHANLPALEAALAAIDTLDCDTVIHTGDAIAIGPFPAETLGLLLDRGVTCLLGNHDLYFAHGLPDPRPDWMSSSEVEHQQWTHAQLNPGLRHVVQHWPLQHFQDLDGRRVLFTHYALRPDGSDFVPIVRLPDAATFDALFADEVADLVFYGHDHTPADMQGKRRYVNPGSLGCAREAVARFAVMDVAPDGTYRLTFEAVPYDDAPLIGAFEDRQVPVRDFLAKAFFGGRFDFYPTRELVADGAAAPGADRPALHARLLGGGVPGPAPGPRAARHGRSLVRLRGGWLAALAPQLDRPLYLPGAAGSCRGWLARGRSLGQPRLQPAPGDGHPGRHRPPEPIDR